MWGKILWNKGQMRPRSLTNEVKCMGAWSYVNFLLQAACTCMCRHIYNWNTVDCDVKPTRHVFVKHGCPQRQQSQNIAKMCESYILTPPHPRGMWCQWSVRNPLMNLPSKFGFCIIIQTDQSLIYCTVCKQDGITDIRSDKRTDRQTDGRFDY